MLEPIWKWAMENPNVLAALSGLAASVAAVFAVFLSVYSLANQRSHNRLSVRPIANFGYVDFENEISIWLRNSGVGPMRIDTITARCDDSKEVTSTLIEQMLSKGVTDNWTTFSGNLKGRTIRAEGLVHLLKLEGETNDPKFIAQRDAARKALLSIELKVTFSDIYGRTIDTEAKHLSWFGRHFFVYDFDTQKLDRGN